MGGLVDEQVAPPLDALMHGPLEELLPHPCRRGGYRDRCLSSLSAAAYCSGVTVSPPGEMLPECTLPIMVSKLTGKYSLCCSAELSFALSAPYH